VVTGVRGVVSGQRYGQWTQVFRGVVWWSKVISGVAWWSAVWSVVRGVIWWSLVWFGGQRCGQVASYLIIGQAGGPGRDKKVIGAYPSVLSFLDSNMAAGGNSSEQN
jgi:hypothetical protein